MTRAEITVAGKVQGVFFRANTQDRAKELGLTGWVRNTPDDTVVAIVEGDKENVEKLIAFMKKGPPGAQVQEVKVSWAESTNEFEDFEVRYG